MEEPAQQRTRILVVDDESNITELVAMALRYEGWEVGGRHTASQAVSGRESFRPALVVLDIMLPDFDGLEVLRRLRGDALERAGPVPHRPGRRRGQGARSHRRRRRLRHQAVQPRGGRRPAARAAAPRGMAAERGQSTVLASATSSSTRTPTRCCAAGIAIELTATEFELLRYLMRNPRRVLSKAQILDRVWNYDFGGRGQRRRALHLLPAQEDRRRTARR